jgi:serine/threonine protein kinase
MEESQNRCFAIKINLTWYTESQIREYSIMKILKDDPISDHPGKTNVIELFDKFIHTGPNGGHSCIVNRPLGRSIERILSEFIWADPVLYSFCCRISIQALQALDLLHQEDIMHGDIHTGDFLLALTYNIDENTVEDTEAKNTHGNDLNDPNGPCILDDKVDITSGGLNAKVFLVDLGASSSPKDLPRFETAYSIPDRAPEILMDIGGATSKADSWALGCVLWCIVTRTPLFAP